MIERSLDTEYADAFVKLLSEEGEEEKDPFLSSLQIALSPLATLLEQLLPERKQKTVETPLWHIK